MSEMKTSACKKDYKFTISFFLRKFSKCLSFKIIAPFSFAMYYSINNSPISLYSLRENRLTIVDLFKSTTLNNSDSPWICIPCGLDGHTLQSNVVLLLIC